jgi:dephospho-CoA kinase
MKLAIGLVGMPGAGKSTALSVAQEFAPLIVMGDVIREEVIKRNLAPSSTSFGKVAKALRDEEGKTIVAKRCVEKIKKLHTKSVIIDGIRSMQEVDIFKMNFHFILIAIEASTQLRHKWLMERKRTDDSLSLDLIQQRDKRELSFGLDEVIQNANFTIQNSGTIENLQLKCRDILKKVITHD